MFAAVFGWISVAAAQNAPPLRIFSTISADATGRTLQNSLIWADPQLSASGVAVAFRKNFDVAQMPRLASLSIFADARYVLWINGEYVDRGPSRFQPNGPQYDVVDVASHLRAGRNAVVVLVVGNLSGGKIMRHLPGLTVLLEADGHEVLRTDTSWKWSDKTRFRTITASWANLSDSLVDARVEDGDWTTVDYSDDAWKAAAKISGESWGPLTRTLIPPLRETPVPFKFNNNAHLPITLKAGDKLDFDSGRIVQAYPVVELDADADSELSIEPYGVTYIARAGRQRHFTIDTQGISHGTISVKSGRATITDFKLMERLYPYERVGSFTSNDDFLNRLWAMCARSCEVLSEDSYVDCADRERVEWMDDTPPGFDITRTAMAGPGSDGKPVYSDPRLLGALIRREALTLQPDGWVKAHTCSDRFDIHAKMEDRTCDWVEGERLYCDATGDTTIMRQTWPAIVAQMNYFLDRRTPRGLVSARDWVVWGNPTGYIIGEATTLNVFVQRALVDAAYLARLVGDQQSATKFGDAANDLAKAINTVLWDESTGTYRAGYFDDSEIAATRATRRRLTLPLTDHLAPSTFHADVFALDRGIVPPDRRARVAAAMLAQQTNYTDPAIMVYYYSIKQMYALDRPELDEQILDLFRTKWAAMVDSPLQCSWEAFSGGSKAHIYGMYPGYFLSSYVLGVRRDAPVAEKSLVIEPHLGNLTSAQGIVVTEFGPVSVSWKREGTTLNFSFEVPAGVQATLRLPREREKQTINLDGRTIQILPTTERSPITVAAGRHPGSL
ncbi:MAG: alpha-L-rhamnosidase C-terminal domain-containing protein [Tepidisphaeraceae bacterium]